MARQNYGVKLRYIVDSPSIRRLTRKNGLSRSWHWRVSSGKKETRWGRRGSLVRPSLPLYMVHCALIDSVLRVRYLTPAVLISYNTLLQFYNDSFANNP